MMKKILMMFDDDLFGDENENKSESTQGVTELEMKRLVEFIKYSGHHRFLSHFVGGGFDRILPPSLSVLSHIK